MAAEDVSAKAGVKAACEALGVSRASLYRRRRGRRVSHPRRRPRPPRTLSEPQQQEVLGVLHSELYVDKAPAQVYAGLLDEGRYLCSVRTMYRVLAANGEVRERRDQLRHPKYAKPELRATGPGQVWSWDITKLRGPGKRNLYSLYVVIDVFSRYVVGWTISAAQENAEQAGLLLRETFAKERVQAGQVTVHSDRGSPMKAKSTAELLGDLGLTQSFSRPRVSNDNPYSESQFRTLKYRPEFPGRFGSLQDARGFCRRFFEWYNHEHYHSGLGLLTPWSVHSGVFESVLAKRQRVLDRAYGAHPERFVRKAPAPQRPPAEVWINEPQALEISK